MKTSLSVRDLLALPEVQRAHPVLLAGRQGLDRGVSWIHVLEAGHASGLLRGGEVVVSTGVALADSNVELRAWVEELAAAGASGVLFQLGLRWAELPPALVRAADGVGLPLIALRTLVPFVDITKAVLTTLVQSSYAELQESARLLELFHRMAVEGRSDAEIVMAVGWLTGTSVVLENRNHRVLAFQTSMDEDSEVVLREWERRSRRNGAGEEWIAADVRSGGQLWGRLIALCRPDEVPTSRQRLAVERGAENVALRRVIEGDGAVFELQARSELLEHLARGRYRYESDGRLRAEAAGFPMTRRTVVGIAIQAPGVPGDQVRIVVARHAENVRLDLLMGSDCAGLVSLPPDRSAVEVLRGFADRLRRELGTVVLGMGEPVTTLNTIRGSLSEAASAARAEAAQEGARSVVRLADVRVRGLLAQLQGDPRLQAYVERELGPLLEGEHAAELAALRAYLREGRNKSAGAQAVRLSRPAFYARLQRAAALLCADLDDAESCMSLQLALLAHGISHATPAAEPAPRRSPATRPFDVGEAGWPVPVRDTAAPASDVP